MQDHHRAGGHFEWDERVADRRCCRQWRRVERFEEGPVVGRVALEDLAERPVVSSWFGPQASVVERGVLDREPEPGDRDGIGVEKGRILVATHLTTDAWLFEDVHRLQREGIGESDVGGDLGDVGVVGEGLELVVEVVLGVTDLVDAQFLGLRQLAVGSERLLFEEAPGARAARQELAVGDAFLFVGGEHRPFLGWFPRVDDLQCPGPESSARVDRHEAGQDEEAVGFVRSDLISTEHRTIVAMQRSVSDTNRYIAYAGWMVSATIRRRVSIGANDAIIAPDGELLGLGEREVVCDRDGVELARRADVAHQPVVGVQPTLNPARRNGPTG